MTLNTLYFLDVKLLEKTCNCDNCSCYFNFSNNNIKKRSLNQIMRIEDYSNNNTSQTNFLT